MKKLTSIALSALAVSALSTSAFADSANDDLRESKAGYQALSAQLETMGYQAEDVNFDHAMTFSQKEAIYNEKTDELQNQFDRLHSAN